MEIKPKYFDHPDRAIRCIEWYVIRNCLCNRDDKLIRENLPQYDPDWVYWQETYNQKAKPAQRALMRAINDGTHKSLDECYDAMASLLKPRARAKLLKIKGSHSRLLIRKNSLAMHLSKMRHGWRQLASVPLNFPKPERRRTMSPLKHWKPHTPAKIHQRTAARNSNPVPPTENR